jgi:hypothetical protein
MNKADETATGMVGSATLMTQTECKDRAFNPDVWALRMSSANALI